MNVLSRWAGLIPAFVFSIAIMKYWEIIADKLSAAGWTWAALQRCHVARLALGR